MCGLHTAASVIRAVLQVKCIWRQSAKYEINKIKLSDVAGCGALAVSPEQHTSPLMPFFLITATRGAVKSEHIPNLSDL